MAQNEMDAVYRTCLDALRNAGVRIRTRTTPDAVEVTYIVPGKDQDIHVSSSVPLPTEVGKLFGKHSKFRKFAKKAAKAIAHSKILKKLAKLAPMLGAIIPPPVGEIVSVAATAANIAMKIKHAAEKGHKGAQLFIRKAHKQRHSSVMKDQLADMAANASKPGRGGSGTGKGKGGSGSRGSYLVRSPTGAMVTVQLGKV